MLLVKPSSERFYESESAGSGYVISPAHQVYAPWPWFVPAGR